MKSPNIEKRADVQKNRAVTVLPPPLAKGPYRCSLTTLSHCRKEMAKVYREARSGKLDSQEATRFGFVLQIIGKLIEAEQFENRLIKLEKGLSDE